MHLMYLDKSKEQKPYDKYLVKLPLYRRIFETKFNLSSRPPNNDTSSACNSEQCYAEHKENYTIASEYHKSDWQKPLTDTNIC